MMNAAGLALLKDFEKCRLTAYDDGYGYQTIGYGHTGGDVTKGLIIDQAKANELLQKDLAPTIKAVTNGVKSNINDNQFSALVCFAFNVGVSAFLNSTLLKLINAGDLDGAAGQFIRWNKVNGVASTGLTRRRLAERALFLATPTA